MLSLFRRKNGKWHEVRWANGRRDIYLSLQFADSPGSPAGDEPTVEKLAPRGGKPVGEVDVAAMVREVRAAVTEYNRRNLCALRVAGIRYRPSPDTDPADHGAAARKLLNLL